MMFFREMGLYLSTHNNELSLTSTFLSLLLLVSILANGCSDDDDKCVSVAFFVSDLSCLSFFSLETNLLAGDDALAESNGFLLD